MAATRSASFRRKPSGANSRTRSSTAFAAARPSGASVALGSFLNFARAHAHWARALAKGALLRPLARNVKPGCRLATAASSASTRRCNCLSSRAVPRASCSALTTPCAKSRSCFIVYAATMLSGVTSAPFKPCRSWPSRRSSSATASDRSVARSRWNSSTSASASGRRLRTSSSSRARVSGCPMKVCTPPSR